MKVRSDIITEKHVQAAFLEARTTDHADIYIDAIRSFRPRSAAYGTEFWAHSLHGKRRTGRSYSDQAAASWSDYGYVIARLYNVDPRAQISFYDNEADFVAKVRQYVPRGQNLDFLDVLDNIEEYT